MERKLKGVIVICLNRASRHLLGGAKENPQNVTQDSRCHNRDSKPQQLNTKQASQLQDLEVYSVAQSVVVGVFRET